MPDKVVIKDYLRGPWSKGGIKYDGPVPYSDKLLPGDVLVGGAVEPRGRIAPIHGVIDFMNRTGQGFTARGLPLYLFHPLDPAWPPMIVGSKDRPSENVLATVQYEHWNDKWPRAGIVRIHGPVGDTVIEDKLLNEAYDREAVLYDMLPETPELPTRVEWSCCFNVDPAGCFDCDDIFGWRDAEDGGKEFMIGISDVSAFVVPGSALDVAARANVSTLYDADGFARRPMFPKAFSEEQGSLLHDGVWRPVLALVFKFKDGAVCARSWRSMSVMLTCSHTYESLVGSPEYEPLYSFLSGACDSRISPTDTHDWVAQAMITYNTASAALLREAGLGILRRHAGTPSADYAHIADKTGCDQIRTLGMAGGEYCVGAALQTSHSGLGLTAYCHASSPLRRYADLVNQRWLKYLLFGGTPPPIEEDGFVDWVNDRCRRLKNLERDLWFLRFIRPHTITKARGLVLEAREGLGWMVYVPEWKRRVLGVCARGELTPGCEVGVEVYCDLRRPRWRDQLVCSVGL
jgi:hypothetical protein